MDAAIANAENRLSFGSKEKLIMECVQRIIGKVVSEFQMAKQYETDKERLIDCATYVFNFLFGHSAISRPPAPSLQKEYQPIY